MKSDKRWYPPLAKKAPELGAADDLPAKRYQHGVDPNPISFLETSRELLVSIMRMLPDDDDFEGGKPPAPIAPEVYRKALEANFDFALLKHQSAVDLAIDAVSSLKGDIERADKVIGAIRRQKKRIEDLLAQWKERTAIELDANGKRPFQGFHGTIGYRKNGGLQPIEYAFDEDAPLSVDDCFQYQIDPYFTRMEIDKERVRTALESGQQLPFATLKERGVSVQFKK